jgi:myosin heavy subunit
VSHSYLSRRVRNGKPAKGYDLRPYALFKENGSHPPEEKTIFGFAFPPGYTPAHSTVDDDQDRKGTNGAEAPLPPSELRWQESARADGGPKYESSGPATEVEDDITEMKEELAELKETISEVNQALRATRQDVSDEQERRAQLDDTLMESLAELLRWKRTEEKRQARLKEDHDSLREELLQMPKDLRDEMETVHDRFDRLHDRIDNLRDWVDTVATSTEKSLISDRKLATQELSTQLTTEIGDLHETLLALHQNDQSGSELRTFAGLLVAQLLTRITNEQQIATLIDNAVQMLTTNFPPEGRSTSALEPAAEKWFDWSPLNQRYLIEGNRGRA